MIVDNFELQRTLLNDNCKPSGVLYNHSLVESFICKLIVSNREGELYSGSNKYTVSYIEILMNALKIMRETQEKIRIIPYARGYIKNHYKGRYNSNEIDRVGMLLSLNSVAA